ncbi:hypothetical protein [Methylobacterium komagatae]
MTVIWVTALVRALISGTVVVLASVLAEILGPVWGALIVSLPVSAGPAYVFMALEHDTDFVAGAALNGFAANAATGLFLTVYTLRAAGRGLVAVLGPATLAWLVAACAISAVSWTSLTALLLNVLVYGVGIVSTRMAVRTSLVRSPVVARPRPLDLLVRAAAVALFVTAVLAISAALGPARTGIVAAFPVTLTSTFVILHRRLGGAAMARLASLAIRGVFGFGLTLLTLHLTVRSFGAAYALSTALLISLIYSAGLLALQPRHNAKEPSVATR